MDAAVEKSCRDNRPKRLQGIGLRPFIDVIAELRMQLRLMPDNKVRCLFGTDRRRCLFIPDKRITPHPGSQTAPENKNDHVFFHVPLPFLSPQTRA